MAHRQSTVNNKRQMKILMYGRHITWDCFRNDRELFSMMLMSKSEGENEFEVGSPLHHLFEAFRPENSKNRELTQRALACVYSNLVSRGKMSKSDLADLPFMIDEMEKNQSKPKNLLRIKFKWLTFSEIYDSYGFCYQKKEAIPISFVSPPIQGENPGLPGTASYLMYESFRPENLRNDQLSQRALAFLLMEGWATKNRIVTQEECTLDFNSRPGELEITVTEISTRENEQVGLDFILMCNQALSGGDDFFDPQMRIFNTIMDYGIRHQVETDSD